MNSEPIAGQTTLPPETPAQSLGPCAWCGERAVAELEIAPARWTTIRAGGQEQRVMAKRPVMSPVCRYHENNLQLTEKALKKMGRE